MLVSVHLPKTAGVSFGAALESHFGAALERDYGDHPLNTPLYERCRAALQSGVSIADRGVEGLACVHGHFLPTKYLLLGTRRKLTFATWMRDPVDRLSSHYRYWRRYPDPQRVHPLLTRMMDEDWSFERFALGPELRNLYDQFLWGFPVHEFDFIGVTEFYEEDLCFFSRTFLDVTLEPRRDNVGEPAREPFDIAPALRNEIEDYHARDVRLYRHALELRRTRAG